MKLYSLLVLHKPEGGGDPTVLKAAFDLTSFGYFQRGSIQEFIKFTSKGHNPSRRNSSSVAELHT